MPQGRIKRKTKLPETLRAKRKDKGPAISKRGNAPVTPRKAKNAQAQKLKKAITKTVNASAEAEIRAVALDGKKSLLSKKEGAAATPAAASKSKKGKKK